MNPRCVKRAELRLVSQIGTDQPWTSEQRQPSIFYKAILNVLQYEMLPSAGRVTAHFVDVYTQKKDHSIT